MFQVMEGYQTGLKPQVTKRSKTQVCRTLQEGMRLPQCEPKRENAIRIDEMEVPPKGCETPIYIYIYICTSRNARERTTPF